MDKYSIYSKSDCINALKLASEELGMVLNESDYERFRNIFEEIEIVYLLLPSIELIRDKFGTFEVVIQEAFQTKD